MRLFYLFFLCSWPNSHSNSFHP